MKRLLFLLACVIVGLSAQAQKVSEQEALVKAQQFLKNRHFKQSGMRRAPQKDAASSPFYIFNAEDNGGFVIVAGDNRMREILGYAEKGNLDTDVLPDNVKWLLDYYAQVADSLSDGKTGKLNVAAATRAELQPLLTTTWDQWAPYNAHCPQVQGQAPPTGCVATAMAQVINYFQWPISEVRSVAAYTTTDARVDLPGLPARKFEWFGMSDDEVAWLMRYCGQSVQMNYMPNESGAMSINIPDALVSVFNYSRTAKLVERSSYTDAEWEELMYGELSVGRPVIYGGNQGEIMGHSFVVHGYRNGMFYVNWGWSGNFDGYFALTDLSPNSQQHFNDHQTAVIAIQPATLNDDSDDIPREELTIRLTKAGTLPNYITEKDKYTLRKLTIIGEVNGTDFKLIRALGGYSEDNTGERGQLEKLDLSEAKIVAGGDAYYDSFTTEDNTLGAFMFERCNAIQEIVLPSSLTVLASAPFLDTGLRAIVIPKGVTYISNGVFAGCRNLMSVEVETGNKDYYSKSNAVYERSSGKLLAACPATVIPEGVTTIGRNAFSSIINLKSIKFPESLTTIEAGAFNGCPLVSVHIPKNVKSIGEDAFLPSEMSKITVDSNNTVYDSRDNSNSIIETATNTIILGCNSSMIPEGIVAIGNRAFYISRTLSTITLPQTLKRIGIGAFQNSGLRTLEIPASVTEIGIDAFSNNMYLSTVKVKSSTPVALTAQVFNVIAPNAKLVVPSGTKAKYQSANIWSQFSTILENTEYNPSRTLNVKPAGSLSKLISESEYYTIEELTLTGELNNDDFQFIREKMGEAVLRVLDLTNARAIDGSEYDVICENALAGVSSLEEVRLPKTLKTIKSFAFFTSGVKSLVIPKTVTSLGRDMLYNCSRLSALSVETGNTVFDSRNNCNAIIDKKSNVLLVGCRTTVIPSSVVEIGQTAFSGVPGLSEVVLPNGVKKIGINAFWADTGLSSVRISKSVTEIGEGIFVGCSSITSLVVDADNPVYDSRDNCNAIIETASNSLIQGISTTKIPESVVKIAPAAFEYQLMSFIEIPASVTEIGQGAFMLCNNLINVVSHIRKPFPINSNVFAGDNMESAVLHVPYGTKNAYSMTSGWSVFPKIVEMEPGDEDYAHHAASVSEPDFGKHYAGLNSLVVVPISLVGESVEPITNIDYTITTGSNVYKGHMDVSPITYMMTAEVLIPFPADAAVGTKTKTLTITKVNGLTNETAENKATGTLVTVKRKPKKVPLVEEATGTWCGWCPRGAVGMRMLNNAFRDDVVTIAVHHNDPLQLSDYYLDANSFPGCQINRGGFVDPYYGSDDQPFGIRKDVEAALRDYTIGEIAVNAEWTDKNQTAIKVTTTTTFVENVSSSPYQIGYLLLEDGQTGFAQKNYFSGKNITDTNLKPMVDQPAVISDFKHDHVPVAVWQPKTGVAGTLPATIKSEVPMTYTYTLSIAGNTRIQNKENLSVVALLLNKNTHEVLNAAKFKFNPDVWEIKGDADGDGSINVTDVMCIVDYILGKPLKNFIYSNANWNEDGEVNVTDAMQIVDYILGKN